MSFIRLRTETFELLLMKVATDVYLRLRTETFELLLMTVATDVIFELLLTVATGYIWVATHNGCYRLKCTMTLIYFTNHI
jgi:hypothetical protein